MFVIRFRCQDGTKGEIEAGRNRTQAQELAASLYVGKAKPKKRARAAMRTVGLSSPVESYRIDFRTGNFAEVKLRISSQASQTVEAEAGDGIAPERRAAAV